MNECMDRWIDGWMEGRTDGPTDERTNERTNEFRRRVFPVILQRYSNNQTRSNKRCNTEKKEHKIIVKVALAKKKRKT